MKHLRFFFLLLPCSILPLLGNDEQAASPALLGALRSSGLPAEAESVTIPLQSTDTGFTVEVQIDGKPLQLVLDTGAAITSLSPEAARKLGLEAVDWKANIRSARGGQLAIRRALTKHITVGEAWTENEPVFVADLPPRIDGLLGISTLADWDVRIDPLAGSLTLFPAGQAPPQAGGTVVPLTRELVNPEASRSNRQGLRIINLSVPVRAGAHELTAIPDLGYGGVFQLSSVLSEKYAPEAMKNSQPGLVTGIDLTGKSVSRSVKLPEFAFGPDTLRGLPVEVIEATHGTKAERHGLIGRNLLRHYVMTFHIAAGELHLKPLGSVQEVTQSSTAGIYLDPDNKILSVVLDGPAAKAGLRAGDELLEIEGHPLKTMTPEVFAAFRRLPPGSLVKVRYRRGGADPVEAALVLVKE